MLKEFAEQHRVKIVRSGEEMIAPGKYGEIADDYGNGLLRVRLLAVPRDRIMNGALNSRKKQAGTAGMVPLHVAEHVSESIWGFRSDNEAHCRLAIELVRPRIKRTRILTDEQRQALASRLAVYRAACALNTPVLEKKPSQERSV